MDEKDIISTDFNYDIYSGGNAKKYLDEYNARKKQEAEENAKTDAERKRDEYRKRFEGMSADEIFAQPAKKKKPEDDFSDFFDADEIERQKEKVREFEQEQNPLPTLENMMPGEDSPSSEAPEDHTAEALEYVEEMMAHSRIQRAHQDEMMHNLGHRRYYRRTFQMYAIESLLDSFGVSEGAREVMRRIGWYLAWCFLAASIYGLFTFSRYRHLTPEALIFATGAGFVSGVVWNCHRYGKTILQALIGSIVEALLFAAALVLVLFISIK